MKNNFFNKVKEVLTASDPKTKFELFEKVYKEFLENRLNLDPIDDIEVFKEPSYKDFCTIVDPKQVPKRTNLASDEGKSTLLHAIAHIEYSAIDLALDACYRFMNMPFDYYKDWMEVADYMLARGFLAPAINAAMNHQARTHGLQYVSEGGR